MPKAQEIKDWLKVTHAVSTVSEEDFCQHYLPAAHPDKQPEYEQYWSAEQQKLVDAIGRLAVEDHLYTENAPLLQLCNRTSQRVYESLPNRSSTALVFYSHHDKFLRDQFYEEKSLLSPDIIVLNQNTDKFIWESVPSATVAPQAWSDVVAIGEAKVVRHAQHQTGAYLLTQLQHRPDLHSVLGFSANTKGYTLLYHDTSVIHKTPACQWTSGRLLHAFIRQLYQGMPRDPSIANPKPYEYDPSINRPNLELASSWMIRVNDLTFVMGTNNVRCNPGLGQRRFTAIAKDATTLVDWFIKDNYRDERHKFFEGNLFMKAHGNGRAIPGLMRAFFHGYVWGEDGGIITTTTLGLGPRKAPPVKRCKTRMVTPDVGLPLKEMKSLREFLGTMYDACVVQRNLYRKCKILHRDISDNNIMVAPRIKGFHERWEEGYDGVKYLNQVLAGNAQPPCKPEPACLIVDLGNAVDLEDVDRNSGILSTVTGTPKFMARSVSGHNLLPRRRYLPRSGELRPPKLEGKPYDLYVLACGNEYDAYNRKFDEVLSCSIPAEPRFKHQLFHDAESTFWVIAWFLACSAPKGYQPETDWNNEFIRFIRGMREHCPNDPQVDDSRLPFVPENWAKILHPSLASVAPMLAEMHSYIDPEWGYRPDLDDEHAHDALMRLLLIELIRIEDKLAEDIEFAGRVRDLPVQTKPTSSLSTSMTTHTPSLTVPQPSKKRSHSQSDDGEPENSPRPSPRSALLRLQETDQTNRTPHTNFNDILVNALKHDWTGVPNLQPEGLGR